MKDKVRMRVMQNARHCDPRVNGGKQSPGARICTSRVHILFSCAMLVSLLALPSPAQAQGQGGPIRKLGRGLGNIVTGWLELFVQPMRTTERSGSWAGMTEGMARGVFLGVGRTVVGALELVTFPIPNPTTGYEPVIEPEFVTFRDGDRW